MCFCFAEKPLDCQSTAILCGEKMVRAHLQWLQCCMVVGCTAVKQLICICKLLSYAGFSSMCTSQLSHLCKLLSYESFSALCTSQLSQLCSLSAMQASQLCETAHAYASSSAMQASQLCLMYCKLLSYASQYCASCI